MALEARSRDLGHRRACAAADSLPPESTLLRAKPPKGGDAEPRGYRGRRPPRSPGRQRPTRVDVGGPVCVGSWGGGTMPLAYKLACRLARLKHRTLTGVAAAVAAAVVLSCELPQVATPNVTVSQLIITPQTVTLQLNQDQDFVAVGLSAAGDTTPSTVSWDVTGGTITDMGASGGRHYGQYHGGTCGSFKVAATSHPDRTTDTATVTVAGCVAPVAAVTVSPAAPTVQVGQTAQLTATPRDASGNPLAGRVITWQSSNGAVASVNGSGLVTAVATGAATITATSEGQSGTAVVTVSNVPVASVTVTPASASVPQGATVQLTATPRDANGTALTGRVVTWGSNNTAVATVSGSGLVSGAGAGSATITATSEGQSGTAAITVTAPTGQLAIGDSVQATTSTWVRNIAQPPADPATGTPPSVIGTQSAGARGVVDSGPVLNTTPGGDGAIRYHVLFAAAPSGWVVQDYLAKIVPTVPVASVTVSPASVSVLQGQTVQLTATPRDAIGSVNGSGLVSGVAAGGPVTITATSEGQSGTASITVSGVPVASVTVSPASASVPAGQTVQLSATLRDANGNILTGRSVTWASNNTSVATVTGTGLVTGKVAGSATITATSEGQNGTAAITVTPSAGAQFDHVFIVLEENNDYSSVTSSSMPYLTGLAAQYGLATQYYANTHPSLGNYPDMTSGTVLTNDDSYSGSPFNVPNIFRSLIAAGKSWKGYAEDLPSTGFVDYTQIEVGQFASRHFPPIYYTDVHDNPAQAQNVVPFTQFATDLANGTLPNYWFIVPNLCNDAHDCSLNTADSWLQQNIHPLVRSAFFQQNNCLLIITFDQAGGVNTNGGGQVYCVAVSTKKSKRGSVSTTLYQHQSTLRLMLKGLGVTSFPGDAATAPDMSEFFTP